MSVFVAVLDMKYLHYLLFLMVCVIVNHNGFGHFGVRLLDFVGFDFEQSPESVAKHLATDIATYAAKSLA